jgi:hypothetical protein
MDPYDVHLDVVGLQGFSPCEHDAVAPGDAPNDIHSCVILSPWLDSGFDFLVHPFFLEGHLT